MRVVHVPELDAAVGFHAIPTADVAAPEDIRVPFQAHFPRKTTRPREAPGKLGAWRPSFRTHVA